jgi:hypothetical protein
MRDQIVPDPLLVHVLLECGCDGHDVPPMGQGVPCVTRHVLIDWRRVARLLGTCHYTSLARQRQSNCRSGDPLR